MLILLLLSTPLLFTEGKVVLKSAESDFLPDDDVTQQPHKPHKPDLRLKPEETRKIAAEDDDGHKVERERERKREKESYSRNRLAVYDIKNLIVQPQLQVIVTGMSLLR